MATSPTWSDWDSSDETSTVTLSDFSDYVDGAKDCTQTIEATITPGEFAEPVDCQHIGTRSFIATANAFEATFTDSKQFQAYGDHDLTHVEAAAATCTEEGNSEYWHCGTCGKYFSDQACKHEIEENSWIIPIDENAHNWDLEYTESRERRRRLCSCLPDTG